MLVLLFVVFYFFMIKPQRAKQKEQQTFRESLKEGDKVITAGGLYGKVKKVDSNTVLLEIADNVRVTVDKNCIFASAAEATPTNESK